MGRYLVALAVLAAGVTSTVDAAPGVAATGTWGDDHVHDYVGLAAFYDDDGVFSHQCSGALVSDTTFLTAGHCTDGASSARIWFHREIGTDPNPDTGFDAATGYPRQCLDPARCVSSEALYDYGFEGLSSFPDTRDLGLVIFRQPPTAVTGRAELPDASVLDPLGFGAERNRTVFTVSGYGRAHTDPLVADDGGRRRVMASARITELRSSLNDGFNLQSNSNGRGFGGSCAGDAGGPVFLGEGGSDTIVAITSFGLDAWCRGTDLSYRIDRPEILDWIRGGYLASTPEPAS